MGCAIGMIKYILFIFNFIFALCGLAILIIGVLIHLQLTHVTETVEQNITFPSLTLIVVGVIIFVIAFFGCCGAIQESHCMTVIYASCLLTILILQVAVTIYAFAVLKNADSSETHIKQYYMNTFKKYWSDSVSREVIDNIQSTFQCCGATSSADYQPTPGLNFNGTIPWSCCSNPEGQECDDRKQIYQVGCVEQIKNVLQYAGNVLGGIAIGIAGVELVGIIFALCLANSIKNSERRDYRV